MKDYSISFRAFGHTLEFAGDSEVCLGNISSYLTLPECERSDKPDFFSEIREVPAWDIDGRIPLPDESLKVRSCSIIADRTIEYRAYAKEEIYWTDYHEVARVRLDYMRGAAQTLIVAGNPVLPTYQRIFFIDHALDRLFAAKGSYSIHASCANINGRGFAFTGSSGSGKSTAAYALLRREHAVITDEKLFLFRNAGYCGGSLTDIVKVRAEAVSGFFPELLKVAPYDSIGEENYYQLRSTGYRWMAETAIDGLCVLEQTGQPQTFIERINPAHVIGHLFPVTMTACSPYNRAAKFNFLMEFLDKTPCYRVRFGTDMDGFVNAVETLASSGR